MEQSDTTRSRLRGKAVRYLALRDFDASMHVIPDAALISMKLWEGREKLERLRGKIGTFSARDESFGREKILTREDGETMVTAKLLTLRRIKATSRLRGGTRNTRKPVASSAHEGCVVFANGSTLPILICVNTLDAFISEESIKAFLVLRNVFDVCHAYFRTKINAGRTISFFFFSSSFARQKFIISAFVQKKKASFLLTRYFQKFSRGNYAKDNFSFEN